MKNTIKKWESKRNAINDHLKKYPNYYPNAERLLIEGQVQLIEEVIEDLNKLSK